jgi:hypothetical protein
MIWTLERVEELANGRMWWIVGRERQRRIRKLRPRERQNFERAKLDGFLVVRCLPARELDDVWWRYCGALRLPCIKVIEYRTRAQVRFDLSTTDGFDCGAHPEQRIENGCSVPDELLDELISMWRSLGLPHWPRTRRYRAAGSMSVKVRGDTSDLDRALPPIRR